MNNGRPLGAASQSGGRLNVNQKIALSSGQRLARWNSPENFWAKHFDMDALTGVRTTKIVVTGSGAGIYARIPWRSG